MLAQFQKLAIVGKPFFGHRLARAGEQYPVASSGSEAAGTYTRTFVESRRLANSVPYSSYDSLRVRLGEIGVDR